MGLKHCQSNVYKYLNVKSKNTSSDSDHQDSNGYSECKVMRVVAEKS